MPTERPSAPIFAHVANLKAYEWVDLAVAAAELALARLRLKRTSVPEMLRASVPLAAQPGVALERVERVAKAIARAASRVPWRSDCLIQALAARRWLSRHGIRTEISLGVPLAGKSDFEAHAWLTYGNVVVTGGDISRYAPFHPTSK